MNTIRICTVVRGNTPGEFLERLERAERVSDMVELSIDSIKNFSVNDIARIRAKTTKESIFTCRKREEGGFFEGSEPARAAILEQADKEGFDYLDVEFSSYQSVRGGSGNTKRICSFHDFQKTPSLEKLEEMVENMKHAKPDIIKIATMVNSDNDVKNLFSLLLRKPDEENMIVVGMGEKGKITRILAPLLGGYLTYASFEDNASAPGQIDVRVLKSMTNKLTS